RTPRPGKWAGPPAKGEMGRPGGASLGGSRPSRGDERLRLGKKARVVMHEVRAEEEEGPWGKAIVPDRHCPPRPPCHQPRRGIEPQCFREDHPSIPQLRQIRSGRQPPPKHALEL